MKGERLVGRDGVRRAREACALAFLSACAVDSRSVSSLTPEAAGASGQGQGQGADPGLVGSPPSGGSAGTGPREAIRIGSEAAAAPPCGANGVVCTAPLPFCLPRTSRCVSCAPGAQRCTAGTSELCNSDGVWASQNTTCGECVPDSAECSGSTLRVCSSAGRWVDRLQCAGSQPVCLAATASCVCDDSSCGAGELCSAETRSCEPEVSDCPAINATQGNEDNDLGIVSVRFEPGGSARVTIQNIGGGIIILAPERGTLCNGADNCIFISDDVSITLDPRESFERTLPSTVPSGGEVAMLSAFPPDAIGFGYVAWGSGPAQGSLEVLANADTSYWQSGDRVLVESGDTGFVCTGRADLATGYSSCNP